MAKRLFFAAMTCCMVICSAAFVACSDDDDSGNGTSGGGEVDTEIYQDGVEGVMNYFYEYDTEGNKKLVMGTALNKDFPDVLSMRVADEKDAYGHFEAMVNSVDSTCITVHVDRSITANLTDTLGNVKGTAEFVLVNEGGVVASVTFSDGLIEGVSKVDFILESAWPQNDDEKAKQKHFRGNKIYCQVPMVVRKEPSSSWLILSETETRREPLTCVNEPSAGTPAYYVYFDTIRLNDPVDNDGNVPLVVKKYLPTKSTVEAFCSDLGLKIETKGWWVITWYDDDSEEEARGNYIRMQYLFLYGPDLTKPVLTDKYRGPIDGQYYYINDVYSYMAEPSNSALGEGHTGGERFITYSVRFWKYDIDFDTWNGKPCVIIKRVNYDEEWNGTF